MKSSLLEILACPVCKGKLELKATEGGDEITDGSLRCPECNVSYPIKDGIPNLMPPDGS
jgi:uncharacterized protein YbaR (Trm112 family)